MYLVCDVYDDIKYAKVYNFKELYNLLIDEITNDLKGNSNEFEIIQSCANQLNELAKNNNVDESYIIDCLKGYGWGVYNVENIINDIRMLEDFLKQKYDTSDFEKVISLITNGIKNW